MTKQQKNRRLLWVLLCAVLLFIWGNSLMPAEISGGLSHWARRVINSLWGATGTGTQLAGDGILRKIAHATEFAALGAVLLGLLGRNRSRMPHLLLCGLMTSLMDETLQLFVEGRAGLIKDIWIDMAGFSLGVALCWFLWRHAAHRNEGKPLSTQ